jgi:hypothetical protein
VQGVKNKPRPALVVQRLAAAVRALRFHHLVESFVDTDVVRLQGQNVKDVNSNIIEMNEERVEMGTARRARRGLITCIQIEVFAGMRTGWTLLARR